MITLSINGKDHTVDVPADMPILWALRDVVGLTGTKFGCGMALCGACTVQLDGQPIRSCVTPVAAATGKKITTIEAIGETPAGKKVQQAWLDLEVVQCGYCQSGQIMSASALLSKNAQRVHSHWHRRQDHARHESGRNGTGDVHVDAHAHGGRARGGAGPGPARARAAQRQAVRQSVVRRSGDGRFVVGALVLRAAAPR